MFSPLSVCLSVWVFVCLWIGYLKTLWTHLDEIWWRGWICDKDEKIIFWWRSKSRSGYDNYLITFATESGRRLCFHPCLFVCLFVWRISQKVVDGFGRNFGRLGVRPGQIDSILVQVRMQIRPISGIQNVNCSALRRYMLHWVPF